jgi:PAS domain S-box-containing protein
LRIHTAFTEGKDVEAKPVQSLVHEHTVRAEVEAAQQRLTFLAEASSVLASSLDYEATLTNVVHLMVPTLADWCVLDLLAEDGTIQRVATAHADPQQEELAQDMRRRYPRTLQAEDASIISRVLRTGKAVIVPDISPAHLQRVARDAEHFRLLLLLSPKCDMCVPLVARGRTLGAISFRSVQSGQRYGPEDLVFAEELARRAALAVDNARLYKVLQQSQQMLQLVLNNIPQSVFWKDRDSVYLGCNAVFANAHGLRPEDVVGMTDDQMTATPEEAQWFRLVDRRVMERNQPEYHIIEQVHRPGGRVAWLETNKIPLHDTAGKVVGILGTYTDITERKAAEEALRQSEERFRHTFENAAVGIAHVGLDGHWLRVNDRLCEITGYSHEELRARTFQDITHPDDLEADLTAVRQVLAGEIATYAMEKRYIRKDGGIVWINLTVSLVRQPSGEPDHFISIVEDITLRKQAEEALRESEARFQLLANAAPVLIWVHGPDGCEFVNRPYLEFLGVASETDVRGYDWASYVHPDDREAYVQSYLAAVAARGPFAAQCRFRRADGVYRWFQAVGTPRLLSDGTFLGYVGCSFDITEMREAEAELLRARKLESLGVLAGGIAHDFNNLLTGILGNISLAKLLVGADAKVVARLTEAEKACRRATALTQQLLTFAKGGAPVRQTVSLAHLLTESITFALRGSNVRADFRIAEDLWPVDADSGQMSQVLHNVVLNAVQAMPRGGTIEVRADNVILGAGASLPLPQGHYITIAVQDHGCGIPTDVLPKIFDPYFTTKAMGSGLGLATVHAIVAKHDGYIRVDSEVGGGTTVEIYLPASQQTVTPAPTGSDVPLRGHGRILVMDDEAMIGDLLRASLTSLGYEVEYVCDGRAAIAAYQRAQAVGQPFAAVILDSTIPGGMGGRETIAHLRLLNPQVVALLSSGYTNDPMLANYAQYGFRGVVAKPYTVKELQETLQRVLQEGRYTP